MEHGEQLSFNQKIVAEIYIQLLKVGGSRGGLAKPETQLLKDYMSVEKIVVQGDPIKAVVFNQYI